MGESFPRHEMADQGTLHERMHGLNADLHRVTTELTQLRKDIADYPELRKDENVRLQHEALTQALDMLTEAIAQLRDTNEIQEAA